MKKRLRLRYTVSFILDAGNSSWEAIGQDSSSDGVLYTKRRCVPAKTVRVRFSS